LEWRGLPVTLKDGLGSKPRLGMPKPTLAADGPGSQKRHDARPDPMQSYHT
jgi:hypothetical protein